MERLLLFVVVLYVVWRVLHTQGRRLQRTSRGADDFGRLSRDPRRRRGDGTTDHDTLLVCDRCGVVIPRTAALTGDGGERCCASCAGRPGGEGRSPGEPE